MAFRLNVSFQGGGSFLAAMLPVAHAISDAHSEKHIELEGVAGSSAGSVAAALLAGGADFVALREYYLKSMKEDAEKAAGQFYGPIGTGGFIKALINLALGKDLIRSSELEVFFKEIFKQGKVELEVLEGGVSRPLNVKDFSKGGKPKLIVTRSGLELGRLDMPSEGELIPLLVDSCSIPFLLRNFKSARQHAYVDGGLCENLPISGFDLEGESSILAVSISSLIEESNDFSLLSFPLKLFSTAINQNVIKSKEIVGELMTIEENVPFSFHQVSAAVEWLQGEAGYSEIYMKTKRKLLDLASYHTQHHGEGKFVNSRDTKASRDNSLKNILLDLHDNKAFEVISVEMRVNAESLLNPDQASYKRMDIVTSSAKVKVKDPSAKFYKSYIPLLEGRFHPVTWRISNTCRDNKRIEFSPFHFHDDTDGGTAYDPCFIRFDNAENDFKVDDILKVECIYAVPAGMTNLSLNQREFVALGNSHSSPLPLEIVIIYPSFIGGLKFEAREKNGKSSCEFEVFEDAECKARLGPDALTLAAAGVRSKSPVEPSRWLSVWVERDV